MYTLCTHRVFGWLNTGWNYVKRYWLERNVGVCQVNTHFTTPPRPEWEHLNLFTCKSEVKIVVLWQHYITPHIMLTYPNILTLRGGTLTAVSVLLMPFWSIPQHVTATCTQWFYIIFKHFRTTHWIMENNLANWYMYVSRTHSGMQ